MSGANQPWSAAPVKAPSVLSPPRSVFGRVTGAAMRSTFDDIGAAIPFRGFLRIGLIASCCEIQRVPEHHRQADVQRERQPIRKHLVVDWGNRRKISAQSQHIVVCHLGVRWIGHCRIEARTVVPRPSCRAAMNSSFVQLPMLVSRSGVMLGATSAPNGGRVE